MATGHSFGASATTVEQLGELEELFDMLLELMAARGDGDRYIPIAERLENEIEARRSVQSKFDRYKVMHAKRSMTRTQIEPSGDPARSLGMSLVR